MEFGWLGLIELFVVLMFAVAWGCLELYTLRLDRRRAEEEKRTADSGHTSDRT